MLEWAISVFLAILVLNVMKANLGEFRAYLQKRAQVRAEERKFPQYTIEAMTQLEKRIKALEERLPPTSPPSP